ncbi:MAG: PilX N-terminal domain-containing pilus assembly protein [bacterium]
MKDKLGGIDINQRGIVLVISLVLLSALSVMSLISINMVITDQRISRNMKEIKRAFYLAEAGINHAAAVIMQDLTAHPSNWDNYAREASNDLSEQINNELAALHEDGLVYQVTIAGDASNDLIKVTSIGMTDSGAQSKIEVVLSPERTLTSKPAFGLHGCEGIQIKAHATVQSYNSLTGAMGTEGNISTSSDGADIIIKGDVSGDVHARGALTLSDNAQIVGDAWATGDITVRDDNTTITGNLKSSGSVNDFTTAIPPERIEENISPDIVPQANCDPDNIIGSIFSDPTLPDSTINDNGDFAPSSSYYYDLNNNFLTYWGTTYTLGVSGSEKNYYLNGFRMLASSVLTIDGDVVIYIDDGADGYFDLQSSAKIVLNPDATLTIVIKDGQFSSAMGVMVNNNLGNENPNNVKIYLDSPLDIIINESAIYRSVMYAPTSAIDIKDNAKFYGSVAGRTILLREHTQFFYDENLIAHGGTTIVTGFKKIQWKEIY